MICSYTFGGRLFSLFLRGYDIVLGVVSLFLRGLCPPPIITQFVPTKTEYGRGERGEGGVSLSSFPREL